MAPAYDFVSTIPYVQNDTLALNFAESKVFSEMTLERFSRFAAKAMLPEKIILDTVNETVERFAEQWRQVSHFAIANDVKNIIDKHLKKLPLWRSVA